MTSDRSRKDELARLDIHVLSAGVLLQLGLMPLVLYGEIASRTLDSRAAGLRTLRRLEGGATQSVSGASGWATI